MAHIEEKMIENQFMWFDYVQRRSLVAQVRCRLHCFYPYEKE